MYATSERKAYVIVEINERVDYDCEESAVFSKERGRTWGPFETEDEARTFAAPSSTAHQPRTTLSGSMPSCLQRARASSTSSRHSEV